MSDGFVDDEESLTCSSVDGVFYVAFLLFFFW